MPLPLSLLAAAALSTAAAMQSGSSNADEDLLVANADGSWTITAAIHEGPVSLADVTDGLLDDEASDEVSVWPLASERERMREEEADDRLERAFEDALDAVRSADPQR